MTNQGWQCPACKTVYAPHVEKCECSATQEATENVIAPNDIFPFPFTPCEKPTDVIGKPLDPNKPIIYWTINREDVPFPYIWYGRQLNHTGNPTYQNFQIPRLHHF